MKRLREVCAEVDMEPYLRLTEELISEMFRLSKAGKKVFAALVKIMSLRPGEQNVYLAYSAIDQESDPMSQVTFKRGMDELLDRGFLSATKDRYLYRPAKMIQIGWEECV